MQSKNTKHLKEAFESWRLYTSINEEKDYTPGPGEKEQYTEDMPSRKELNLAILMSVLSSGPVEFLYKITPEALGISKNLKENMASDVEMVVKVNEAHFITDEDYNLFLVPSVIENNDNVVSLEQLVEIIKEMDIPIGKEELINDLNKQISRQQSLLDDFIDHGLTNILQAAGFFVAITGISVAITKMFKNFFSVPRQRTRIKNRTFLPKYSAMSQKTALSDVIKRFEKKFFRNTTESIIRQRRDNLSNGIIAKFESAREGTELRRTLSGDYNIRVSYMDKFMNFLNTELPEIFKKIGARPKYRTPKKVRTIRARVRGQRPGIIDPTSPFSNTDRIAQELRFDVDSVEYKNAMDDLDELYGNLEDRFEQIDKELNPDERTKLLDPEYEAKLRNEKPLVRDKKEFIENFIKSVKEFAEKSKGRSLSNKFLKDSVIRIFSKPFSWAKYGLRKISKMPFAGPVFKYGGMLIAFASTLSMMQRAKLYLGIMGDNFVALLFEAIGNIPMLDEYAIAYLEEQQIEAQKKLKAARFVLQNADLTDIQKIIISSMNEYMIENINDIETFRTKKYRLKPTPPSTTPPSPIQTKQSMLDLMESSNNRKLKITLGTINESKKPLNNKKLKITLG